MSILKWSTRIVSLIVPAAAAFAASQCGPLSSNPVVADIGGYRVSESELTQREASRLLQVRNQYYLAERDALEQFIDDYLLEQKAKREHVTVDQLVKRDLESKIQDPTEDQLRVYYEGLGTEEPYSAVHDKILDYIRQHRLKAARAAYVLALRQEAGVVISLAPPSADVTLDGAPTRGSGSRVQIVEFADYECPYCQQIHPLLTKLEQEFQGQVSIAFKDCPLPMHRQAQKAAEAARCAGAQGQFWQYHDLLFSKPGHLDIPQLKDDARALHLDVAQFDRCLDSGEQAGAVGKDLAQAKSLGLTGTPSFFVNGHFLSGAVKYEALRDLVRQELTSVLAARPEVKSKTATASE
jgi:protein-disulfide isomerase